MKLLTLAIAAYNMADYLRRCLDSVIGESLPAGLEVIIVNDGSSDSTSQIAHTYEARYPDSIRVIDKQNAHYGSCINAALDVAEGKYFRPLDADDWVNHDNLCKLLNYLETCSADLVVTEFSRIENATEHRISIPSTIETDKEYDAKVFDFVSNNVENVLSMHCMTFRTELLKQIGLRLMHGISHTDTQYCMLPIDRIKNLVFCRLNVYQYDCTREGRTMQKSILFADANSHYILSLSLIDYYLQQASANNRIIKSNQRCFIRRVLYHFFVSTLVFGHKNKENEKKLNQLYDIINQDEDLTQDVLRFRYKGIPFVQIWQKFHFHIFNFIPQAFK